MLGKAVLVWVVGLLTGVPYATYYLFFEAPRDQYALLITGILFWIFGYWSLAGPLCMAVKLRAVFRALESARSAEELEGILKGAEARDVAIDFLASENHLPRFLAAWLYDRTTAALSRRIQAPLPKAASRSPV